jgi:hypothetical protein
MPEYDIAFDSKYIRRQFEKAVGRSVVKVLTEPVTNSDDSYERLKARGNDDGEGFGSIVIEFDRTKRVFAIVDQAEGMTAEAMHDQFVTYGQQSADRAAGMRTRSLFGKGLRDVLFTQERGIVQSVRDGKAYLCKFRLRSSSGEDRPVIDITKGPEVTEELRTAWGISRNGTRVEFRLNKDMPLPKADRLEADISRFYMLRPLLSRSDRMVILRVISRGGTEDRVLKYHPPAAGATEPVADDAWRMDWEGQQINVSIELLAYTDELVQAERGLEEREGGLLVLDEDRTALDLTLFGYDRDPAAARFFGELRLDGVGRLIRERLAADRPEEILSETRDGFNQNVAFYRTLQDRLYKWLTPHVEKERARRSGEPTRLSRATRKRHAQAFEELNRVYRRLLGETAGTGSGTDRKPLSTDEALEFRWPSLMLQVGLPTVAQLLVNTTKVEPGSGVSISSSAPGVLTPLVSEVFVPEPEDTNPTVVVGVRLETVRVGEAVVSASIGEEEAALACSVLEEEVPDLPAGLAFVPELATVPDGERTTLILYADLRVIDGEAPLAVESDNPRIEVIETHPEWLALNAYIVRANVRVRGSGKGEEAILTARVGASRAEAYVRVSSKREPQRTGGHFRGFEFQHLARKLPAEIDSRGMVVINLAEPTNEMYFGQDADIAAKAVENNKASATLLAELVLDQCLQAAVSEAYERGKLQIRFPRNPVTDISMHIAEERFGVGSSIHRLFVGDIGRN